LLKATGIVRRLDCLGRIVVPKELLRIYDIGPGDPVEIYKDEKGRVVIEKYNPAV
jgi:AbrB family transcriptional regulator (stage V sporulation protein T)